MSGCVPDAFEMVPRSLRTHPGRELEPREEVHFEGVTQTVPRHVLHGARWAVAGVVQQDVDGAEVL